ncbi:MAG: hypothetical protein ACE5IM_12425 [Nitrospinota bacterium]
MLISPRATFLRLAIALILIPTLAHSQLSRPLIPFDAVPREEDRARLLNIASDYSLYRELPSTSIRGDEAQYNFLMDHLDVTSLIVRKLGLGKQRLRRRGPNLLEGEDGAGLSGRMSLVYRERTKRIFLARGRLDAFFFDISGRAAIVAEQVPEDVQRQGLRLALYIKLDNQFLDAMTHLLSPLLSGAVIGRISKFLTATRTASEAIHKDPARILEILEGAGELDEGVKARFIALFLKKRPEEPAPVSLRPEGARK